MSALQVELPSGERLLHLLASNHRKHPLQFGRESIAALIKAPRRADWKLCMPKAVAGGATVAEQEGQLAEGFKAIFASFDPSLA